MKNMYIVLGRGQKEGVSSLKDLVLNFQAT